VTIPPKSNITLKHYLLARYCCVRHGWFEVGDLIVRHSALCPECRQPSPFDTHCDGMTTRRLPFVTRPHLLDTDNDHNWQVTSAAGIMSRPKSAKASMRRGGSRATGRPKKSRPPEVQP